MAFPLRAGAWRKRWKPLREGCASSGREAEAPCCTLPRSEGSYGLLRLSLHPALTPTSPHPSLCDPPPTTLLTRGADWTAELPLCGGVPGAATALSASLLHPGSLPRAVCTSHTVGSASHRISKMSRVGCGRWFIFRKRQVVLLGMKTKFSSAICSIGNGKIKDSRRGLVDIVCGT